MRAGGKERATGLFTAESVPHVYHMLGRENSSDAATLKTSVSCPARNYHRNKTLTKSISHLQ